MNFADWLFIIPNIAFYSVLFYTLWRNRGQSSS